MGPMARSANWHGPISIRTHPWMYRFMATLSVTDFAMESAAYESVMFSSKGYKHVDMRIYVRMAFGGAYVYNFVYMCLVVFVRVHSYTTRCTSAHMGANVCLYTCALVLSMCICVY